MGYQLSEPRAEWSNQNNIVTGGIWGAINTLFQKWLCLSVKGSSIRQFYHCSICGIQVSKRPKVTLHRRQKIRAIDTCGLWDGSVHRKMARPPAETLALRCLNETENHGPDFPWNRRSATRYRSAPFHDMLLSRSIDGATEPAKKLRVLDR